MKQAIVLPCVIARKPTLAPALQVQVRLTWQSHVTFNRLFQEIASGFALAHCDFDKGLCEKKF